MLPLLAALSGALCAAPISRAPRVASSLPAPAVRVAPIPLPSSPRPLSPALAVPYAALSTPEAPKAPAAPAAPEALPSSPLPQAEAMAPAEGAKSVAAEADAASGRAQFDGGVPPAAAPVSAPGESLPIESFTLPNGLRVVVQTDRTSPVVAVSITYNVGSQHERPGRSGFAHLFEHLMAQGTKSLKPREISQLIESRGGLRNAYTTRTNTTYHSLIPRAHLGAVLWAESERMHTLNVDARALALEQQVVLEEMRLRYLNQPYNKAQDQGMAEAAFSKWENRHTTIGEAKDVREAKLDDVRAFYDAHYGPNNAVLALAGDVTLDEAKALVTKHFGPIPARPAPPQPDLSEPPLSADSRSTIADPLAKLPRLMLGWHAPPRGSKDAWALTVLAEALSGGEASPLYQELVKSAQLALSASMTMPWWSSHYNSRGPDLFGVIVPLRAGKAAAEAAAAVERVLERFASGGTTEEELSRAKAQIELQWTSSMQSLIDRAKVLSSYTALIGDPARLSEDLKALLSVTAADIQDALRRWVVGRPRAVVEIVPGAAAAPPAEPATPPVPDAAPRPAGETPPAPEAPRPAPLPPIERFKLANGLSVTVVKDDRLPLVEARLLIPGGRVAERPGEEAAGAAAGALMLKGEGGRDGREIAAALQRLGWDLDLGSGAESVNVSAHGLARTAEEFFRQLASVLSRASYPEKELELWKENTRQRLRDLRSNPKWLAGEQTAEQVFGRHPYRRGTPNERQLGALTRDAVLEFHGRTVRPEGAVLVVVGPVDAASLKPVLERALAGWGGRLEPAPAPPLPAGRPGAVTLVDRPGSSQANLVLAKTVALRPQDPDFLPFLVMNQLLGGSATSRLFLNLRVDKGYTYGAYARAAYYERGLLWTAEAETRNEVARLARDEMIKEVERLRSELVDAKTLDDAKRYLAGLFAIRLAGSDSTADLVARYEREGQDPAEALARYLEKLGAVTASDIQRVARLYLDPAGFSQIVVGDAQRLGPDFRQP